MRQEGISLTPGTKPRPVAKFRIGATVECPQTATRFMIVGTPADCEYLPTGQPVYLCCEDTLDRHILVIPAEQVETDLREVPQEQWRQRQVPGIERRGSVNGDRRSSHGTRQNWEMD